MSITSDVSKIRNAVYGSEVRESIAHAIETCYSDATTEKDNSIMEVANARGTYDTLGARENAQDTAIANEVTARTTGQTALGARIDNLVVAAGGSDVTEVVDARVSSDGTTYTTLTGRISGDVTKLSNTIAEQKEDLAKIETDVLSGGTPSPYNMLNPEKSQLGNLGTTGNFAPNSSSVYLVSDYLKVEKDKVYAFSYLNASYNTRYAMLTNRLCFYDNDKTFKEQATSIGIYDNFKDEKVNVGNNVSYLKFTALSDGFIRASYVANNQYPQFIEGEIYEYTDVFEPTITPYVLKDNVVNTNNVANKSITPEKLADSIVVPKFPMLTYIKMHNKVCCIGDSLTEGYHASGDIRKDKSYPQFISQLGDWDVANKGQSGITSLGWWNAYKDSVDFTTYDCFMIYLGTNGGLTDTIDTDTASGDYNTFAQTNTGGYCAVVAKIKDVNPKAKIYLLRYSGTVTATTITKIAQKYNCIELLTKDTTYYDFTESKYHTDAIHLNTMGYFCFAHEMALQMEKYISEHLSEYTDLP